MVTFLTYLFVILKSVIYGASVFFTGGLTESVDVLDILALRFLMSAVVLWLLKVTKIVKINVGVKDVLKKGNSAKPIRSLLLAAFFEPVLYMLFETLGISMSSDIMTGVILSLSPISVCFCEEILLKEKSTLMQKVFLALGIVGVIYISVNTGTEGGQDSLLGMLFLVMAVVSGSLFLVFSRKSACHFSVMERTYACALLGAVIFNTVNVIRHLISGDILGYFKPYFSVENMIGFFFLAVISTIAAAGMNNFAIAHAQASTLSAFGGVSTLTTIAIGVIFSGEKLYTFHIIGLVLIVARMVGVSYIAIKRDKAS